MKCLVLDIVLNTLGHNHIVTILKLGEWCRSLLVYEEVACGRAANKSVCSKVVSCFSHFIYSILLLRWPVVIDKSDDKFIDPDNNPDNRHIMSTLSHTFFQF